MRSVSLGGVLALAACVARPMTEPAPRARGGQGAVESSGPATPLDLHCPPAVFERVRTVDLADSGNSMLFSSIASETIECQVEALRVIAGRLDGASDPQVIGDFCGAAATLSRLLSPDARDDVRAAYLRFPYSESIHASYFRGLRDNHIDLRAHLAGKITEDWTFEHPGLRAQTWHYHLYLASLDEPGAYAKLAAKLAGTTGGNDATNLLRSLAELGTEPAREILLRHANDTRRADGPSGPGMTIAESVALLLAQHFPRRP